MSLTVGERMLKRRKELGISADDLADVLGINRTSVFRYEAGSIEKMPASTIMPIAEALHVDPVWLLTGNTPEPEPPVPEPRPEVQELLAIAEKSTPEEVLQITRIFRAMKGE